MWQLARVCEHQVVRQNQRTIKSMKSLQGSVVVIAECGSELGKSLALEFARIGARLAVWAEDIAFAHQVAEQVHNALPRADVRVFEVDLLSSASVQQAAKNVRRDFDGRIDVLVNNMDVLHGAPLLQTSDESLEQVLALNARAPMFATQAVLPQMVASKCGGALVNFGTSAESLGAPKLVDYCTSKFAVMGFHDALRHELRRVNKQNKKTCTISMTLVCPTLIAPRRGAAALPPDAQATVPEIWMAPDRAAKEIVRAVRRERATLVLPPDYSMVSGLLRALPTSVATWLRKKLKLSSVMDSYCAPRAGPYAFESV